MIRVRPSRTICSRAQLAADGWHLLLQRQLDCNALMCKTLRVMCELMLRCALYAAVSGVIGPVLDIRGGR